ncbi:MAG TPA: hypothetical protein VJ728_13985 [Candidatus Binataceae bacterium]|nr:hypothetical protein [Candidatus Binataceae bacterium]
MASKSESSPRFLSSQVPEWVLQTAQQIQVIDYELHAAIRIISRGEMQPEHVPAFMDACTKRERLMARLISHVAELGKPAEYQASATGNVKI